MRQLGLDEYCRALRRHAAPSEAQIASFVEHVAGKHSWYKHLPLTPPGSRFILYLDPGAGMQRFDSADGQSGYREIGDDQKMFHYAMCSTSDYRRRYGLLSVVDRGAPAFSLISEEGTAHYESTATVLIDGERCAIPAEIAFIGAVHVTGVIHAMSGREFLWRRHFEHEDARRRDGAGPAHWPEASGGDAVLDALRDLITGSDQHTHGDDARIEALIGPERARQRHAMREQARRLVALVYSEDGSFQPSGDA